MEIQKKKHEKRNKYRNSSATAANNTIDGGRYTAWLRPHIKVEESFAHCVIERRERALTTADCTQSHTNTRAQGCSPLGFASVLPTSLIYDFIVW